MSLLSSTPQHIVQKRREISKRVLKKSTGAKSKPKKANECSQKAKKADEIGEKLKKSVWKLLPNIGMRDRNQFLAFTVKNYLVSIN
jgi:hypothetical protein